MSGKTPHVSTSASSTPSRMSLFIMFILLSLILGAVNFVAVAYECKAVYGYDGCVCYTEKNNTKKYVNLLPLKGNFSTPRFTVKDKKQWFISYSPCGVFSMFVNRTLPSAKSCVKASVARWTNESAYRCENLGDEASAMFVSSVPGSVGGNIIANLTLKFRSSAAEHHSAVISLVCNDTVPENKAVLKYIGTVHIPTDTYYLALTSRCCCPGKCGKPPLIPSPTTKPTGKKSGPLKTWQIIVIAVACVVLVLIIAGTVYCCKTKRGYEAVL